MKDVAFAYSAIPEGSELRHIHCARRIEDRYFLFCLLSTCQSPGLHIDSSGVPLERSHGSTIHSGESCMSTLPMTKNSLSGPRPSMWNMLGSSKNIDLLSLKLRATSWSRDFFCLTDLYTKCNFLPSISRCVQSNHLHNSILQRLILCLLA